MMGDRRGVSTPVSYTLTLSIALVLVSGLLIGGTTMVDQQREQTMESQLSTVGEQIAGTFETADRLVTSSEDPPANLSLVRSTPNNFLGSSYAIRIYDDPRIEIDSASEDVTIDVGLDVETAVADGDQVPGGKVAIRYNTTSSPNQLVIENA